MYSLILALGMGATTTSDGASTGTGGSMVTTLITFGVITPLFTLCTYIFSPLTLTIWSDMVIFTCESASVGAAAIIRTMAESRANR